MKTTFKTKKWFGPPLKRILPEIFLMTFHLNSHRTTDIQLEMYQVFKLEMELHMIDIIYAELSMRE